MDGDLWFVMFDSWIFGWWFVLEYRWRQWRLLLLSYLIFFFGFLSSLIWNACSSLRKAGRHLLNLFLYYFWKAILHIIFLPSCKCMLSWTYFQNIELLAKEHELWFMIGNFGISKDSWFNWEEQIKWAGIVDLWLVVSHTN